MTMLTLKPMWGSASALLTIDQLEIIKSVMENK